MAFSRSLNAQLSTATVIVLTIQVDHNSCPSIRTWEGYVLCYRIKLLTKVYMMQWCMWRLSVYQYLASTSWPNKPWTKTNVKQFSRWQISPMLVHEEQWIGHLYNLWVLYTLLLLKNDAQNLLWLLSVVTSYLFLCIDMFCYFQDKKCRTCARLLRPVWV